jgi:hypothetical protein
MNPKIGNEKPHHRTAIRIGTALSAFFLLAGSSQGEDFNQVISALAARDKMLSVGSIEVEVNRQVATPGESTQKIRETQKRWFAGDGKYRVIRTTTNDRDAERSASGPPTLEQCVFSNKQIEIRPDLKNVGNWSVDVGGVTPPLAGKAAAYFEVTNGPNFVTGGGLSRLREAKISDSGNSTVSISGKFPDGSNCIAVLDKGRGFLPVAITRSVADLATTWTYRNPEKTAEGIWVAKDVESVPSQNMDLKVSQQIRIIHVDGSTPAKSQLVSEWLRPHTVITDHRVNPAVSMTDSELRSYFKGKGSISLDDLLTVSQKKAPVMAELDQQTRKLQHSKTSPFDASKWISAALLAFGILVIAMAVRATRRTPGQNLKETA